MNKTCRGCNKELDNCTCNVLTTGKKLTTVNSLAIRELDRRLEAYANTCNLNQAHIKDLERINESHRIENGKLQERIKELEKLIPTKEEAKIALNRMRYEYDYLDFKPYALAYTQDTVKALAAKLQKIIGDK
jgi:predicted RNase H-like nuclease (RuvC/YqgF family)